ncbi:MAG TPA: hypothetical protein VFB36_07755 [Nevskiaceae bacterium]|nr:hypothetical protein [Nevskiaceae bacterium]
MKKTAIAWRAEPKKEEYPSAYRFLSLIQRPKHAKRTIDRLRRAAVSEHKAIDVLRASREPLLDVTNSHVKEDHNKIVAGEKLSPPMLVRDPRNSRVIIVDGYHRICAVCSFDEDAGIPCKIV